MISGMILSQTTLLFKFFFLALVCNIANGILGISPISSTLQPFSNTNPAVKDLNTGFIGCFIDGDEPYRDMGKIISSGATAADGRNLCSTFKYFGLQYTGQLFCSNTFGNYASYVQVDDSECNLFGFQTGGSWRNAVFLTNFQPSTSSKTSSTTTTSTPTVMPKENSFGDYVSNNISWIFPTIIVGVTLFLLICIYFLRQREVARKVSTDSVIIGIGSHNVVSPISNDTSPNKYAHRRFPSIKEIIVPN